MSSHTTDKSGALNIAYYVLLATGVVLVAAVRFRLLAVPLERDEGEFAYLAHLMLKGVPPYLQAYSMKPPGIFAVYALSMFLFGQTATGIHAGLLLANIATMLLLFVLGRRLFGDISAAVCSALCYAMISLSSSVMGVFAHATHYVVLFVVLGSLFLHQGLSSGRNRHFYLSGLALGLGLTMKQPALFFIIGIVVYLAYVSLTAPGGRPRESAFRIVLLSAGCVTVIGGMLIWLWRGGVLGGFWFWTYQYPSQLVHSMSFEQGLLNFRFTAGAISARNWPVLILAASGAFLAVLRLHRDSSSYLVCLLLAGIAALLPGFYFTPHYYVVLFPAIALFAGYGIAQVRRFSLSGHPRAPEVLPLLLMVAIAVHYSWDEMDYLFRFDPPRVSRMIYHGNPFPESPAIAAYLKANSTPSDRIAILGSEPQIAFYADRQLAARFSQIYPLMEDHPYAERMQNEMIREIEQSDPKFLLVALNPSSWSETVHSRHTITGWMYGYIESRYVLDSIVDVINDNTTICLWNGSPRGYTPQGEAIVIYKRQPAVL